MCAEHPANSRVDQTKKSQPGSRYLHYSQLSLSLLCLSYAPQALADKLSLADTLDALDRITLEGYLAQGLQTLEADDNAFDPEDADTSPGFNRFRFSLGFNIEIADGIDAFVELSDEPNDFGNDFTPHVDLALINVQLNEQLTLQSGTIVTVLFNYRGFSDGAVVQGNPLIGNSPIDLVTAAEGAKLIGNYGRLNWDIGLSTSDFGESFGSDRGFTYLARASYALTNHLGIGIGAGYSDHGDQVREGRASSIVRAGLFQGDGENYRFPSADNGGIRNTHSGLIPGLDTRALLIDAEYKTMTTTLRTWAGYLEDDFSFGDAQGNQTVASQNVAFIEQESEMALFGIEGSHYLKPKSLYVAARYSYASNESDNVTGDDELTRLQLGAGYWFRDNVLLKVELVHQQEGEASPGQIGDDWSGFSFEASAAF